ncbi:MAG TPA: hypothetical protein VEB20_18815 [Azospirillaceae bacterium]|nr:hypothetical protein [Azospirillaceae bacterium]
MSGGLTQEWEALADDAARLNDAKFLKIFHLLEQLGDKPGIQSAFQRMRPRLAELRPPRRPSVSRIFFRPVEDLLDDPEGYQRRLNRIARSTLLPCWKAVRERMDAGLVASATSAISRCDPHDAVAVMEAATPFWREGADAVVAVIEECRNNLKFKVDNFGRDEDVLRQLETIRLILSIGPELEALKLKLPERPIGELAESHLEFIRQTLTELGKEDARKAAPLMLALTARMRKPGDLLKLLAETRLGGSPADKEEMSKELSGYVVGNLLRQTAEIDRASPGADAAPDLAATAERLTEGLNSVTETVSSMRDKQMSDKVASARAEIGDFVVRNIVENVDRNLLDTLFQQGAPAGDEEVKRAEQLALALRRSAKLAPFLGIKREVDAKIAEVRQQIDKRTDGLLSGSAKDPALQRQVFNSLRMIEILAGSDEAERLYRSWKLRMG